MPSFCGVINCGNRGDRDIKSFFRLPGIPNRVSEAKKKLLAERRRKWLAALRRADLTEKKIKYLRICEDHFILGKPSDLEDIEHPDWVPSKNMGYDVPNSDESILKRYERRENRKKRKFDDIDKDGDAEGEDAVDRDDLGVEIQDEDDATHQYKPEDRRQLKRIEEACEGCKDLTVFYPEQGLLLRERFRLRSTAVPSLRLPEPLPDEVKRLQTVKENSLDTECMKLGLHQEDAIKLSNGDSPGGKKSCSNYLDSDVNKMSETEPISLDDNMKNKHHISMEMSDNERITDSEEDSEYSLQETIFDPCSFPCSPDNVEEILTRKLELVKGLYEKSWKKMKFYQKKCKLYAKQSIALKEVIESLKQINSVPNDL